jgi:ubiquinone/menaquinone biosynthesis C-methylase UbiE
MATIHRKGAAGMSDAFIKETERTRRIWEKQAPRYDRSIAFWEKVLFGDGREWVCSRAQGEVLEVAVGTGRNLAFYPEGVRLTGIDLSPAMLEQAREKARELGMEASLREGDAQDLPFPDEAFDTVVCTLSLCNIPDDRRAVAEMKRVLRPGGRLLLLDHIRAASGLGRAVQKALEVVMVPLEGEHLLRRPLEHVRAEGFRIEEQERYKGGIVERVSARMVQPG